ncbi:ABC-2 transporter permease [Bifidobacterium pullorum subsp. saeculare]|uniref:ABC-2 transporter permease n=1 Tax=Bifidobacterium pullorum subsp. saeculare TaxID=78257 RepID=A0A938WWA7_9BIFI|nr:ABC-2 transporter permease [Bifidobacterium pullorum]MBM6699091.1 ABC-2 transporter permease [Bifidobacterium pullorum subsp. saeculare]
MAAVACPRPAWHGVLAACRLDAARLFGGRAGTVAWLCWPMLAAMVIALLRVGGVDDLDFTIGGIQGAAFGVTAISPLSLFTLDARDDGTRMNGVVPATPTHRVLGRYLTMAVLIAVFAVNLAVIQLVLALTDQTGPDGRWGTAAGVVAALVASALLIEAAVMPCFYRWGMSSLRFIFTVAMFALILLPFLAVLLVSRLPDGARRAVMDAVRWLAVHPPVTAAIAAAVLVAACAGSLATSLHVVRTRAGERESKAPAAQATARTVPATPRSHPAAMAPVLRVLRLDLMDLWPDSPGEGVTLLIPFVFLLLVPFAGAAATLPICAAVTVFLWSSSAWGLFQTTTHSQYGRFAALLPVRRGRQVTARWIAIGIAGLACLVQLAVEAVMLVLADPTGLAPSAAAMTVGLGMAAYLLAAAVMTPLLYAFDFMRVLQMFWWGVAFLVIGGTVISAFIPVAVRQAFVDALRTVSAGGWLAGVFALAVLGWAVAIPVSRAIWTRRQL